MSERGASLFVRGARTYPPGPDARTFDLRIVDGVLDAVGPDLDAGGLALLDAQGLTAIPGLIDVHVHFRDPGLARKEGWDTGSAGALHGGVTSVVEVQNNPPLSTSLAALRDRIEHVRRSSRVDFGCLANLLPDSVPELAAMAPYTPAFKCFLGGSTGVGGQADRGTLHELFAAAARAGRMVVAHCEDEDLLQRDRARFPDATAVDHHVVRSTQAEVLSIRAAIEMAEQAGAELHVFHVSTGEGAELVRAARARGSRVSASTAPHYLLLSCDDAERLGNRIKVNPSVKTSEDSTALRAAVEDGAMDAIGTDHAPHPLEEKERPYAKSPSGMPSVDLLWPLTYELVRRGELSAEAALASVTSRAAGTLHLPGKGRLEPGCDGDLVLFDPSEERIVDGRELPSKSKWSAYDGWKLSGFPTFVIRRGEPVWSGGSVTGPAGGEPLRLEPPVPIGR